MAANVSAFKSAMAFFTKHLQQVGQKFHIKSLNGSELTSISGLVDVGAEAEEKIVVMIAEKVPQVVSDFISQLDWTPGQPSSEGVGSEMVQTMIAYLNMTSMPLTTLLPTSNVAMLYKNIMQETSRSVLNTLLGDIEALNMFGILNFNSELAILEDFAENAPLQGLKVVANISLSAKDTFWCSCSLIFLTVHQDNLEAQQLYIALEDQEDDKVR